MTRQSLMMRRRIEPEFEATATVFARVRSAWPILEKLGGPPLMKVPMLGEYAHTLRTSGRQPCKAAIVCHARDKASGVVSETPNADDYITIEWRNGDLDYTAIVEDFLPRLAVAFGAYRAQLGPLELQSIEIERFPGASDWRRKIPMIYPSMIADEQLVQSAWGLTLAEAESGLRGAGAAVRQFENLVQATFSQKAMSLRDALALNATLSFFRT